MSLTDLLKQQRIVLESGDTTQALGLLDAIEEQIDRAGAWAWLQRNAPESYERLIRKRESAAEGLAQSGRWELRPLARVFGWCEKHGIELATFELPNHLAKYREAASRLNPIITSGAEQAEIKQQLFAAIETIKSHPNGTTTSECV